MTAISGQKCYVSSRNPTPLGSLVKTFLASSEWHSTMCALTWNQRVTKSNRLYYQLVPSMHTIEETESGFSPDLWPTPTVHGNYNRKGVSKKSGDGLATAVKLWPTPTQDSATSRSKKYAQGGTPLQVAVKMWPTPLTRDYKGGRAAETLKEKGRTPSNSLPDAVTHQEGKTGQLNPTWVEWLMGFPIGWTELSR